MKETSQESSQKSALPRWSLDSIYPGTASEEYKSDKKNFQIETEKLQQIISTGITSTLNIASWICSAIEQFNRCFDLYENLEAICFSLFSTDTTNPEYSRELNEIESLNLPLKNATIAFRKTLKTLPLADLKVAIENKKAAPDKEETKIDIQDYRFFIEEELLFAEKQMSPEEEDLAADLSRAGGDAWGRLQDVVSSTLTVQWEENKNNSTSEKTEEPFFSEKTVRTFFSEKTVIELRALAHDNDRSIRQKAYKKELEAWKQVEVPMAFSLNGVKGFSAILNNRRKYESTLERSILQSRMSKKSLEALISSMEGSLPMYKEYYLTKAKMLGLEKLAFYDIFAPVGDVVQTWSFQEAKDFILKCFYNFSDNLGSFAERTFENGHIDAEPRKGKIGGAYCISFGKAGESRIFANFDGSIDSVTTLAHELGHAYHFDLLKDSSAIHRNYPMPLAETASIFSETIVFNEALTSLPENAKVTILENFLQSSGQVIVDILSRFYFESAVMEKREKAELSAEEFCSLMVDAQKRTYGDALNEVELHPYMWAVKGHYYNQDLAFYNFPYAFGQLFGLGIYSLYKKQGNSFTENYDEILRATGKMSAVDVAAMAGFSIEDSSFWENGLSIINEYVKEFSKYVS